MCWECFTEALRLVQRRIRVGRRLALAGLALFLAVGLGLLLIVPVAPDAPGGRWLMAILFGPLFVLFGAYFFWATYWGWLAAVVRFKLADQQAILGIIVGLFGIGIFAIYGMYGGGVYTYLKHRRFAQGVNANAVQAVKLGLARDV